MNAYVIRKGSTTLDGLQRVERPVPLPGPNEVLIRVHAVSLNYRDHAIVTGQYFSGAIGRDTIPASDGAGLVTSVGANVTRFKAGDRVAGCFFQGWVDGPPAPMMNALGVPLDGMLAEYVALHQDGVVAIPSWMSFEEGATLPCAGVTAWNALMMCGTRVKPGDTVLCLGTGGVSIFGLQFARAAGARVIITSSSGEKLDRAHALGASGGINYKSHPDWEKEVMNLTDGRGVDHILEVGGSGTLARSYRSVGFGGKIVLIGFLAQPSADTNTTPLMFRGASLHGVRVGSRAMFEQMIAAIEVNRIKPVVDRVFPFDQAAEAWKCLASGKFFGKLVIEVAR